MTKDIANKPFIFRLTLVLKFLGALIYDCLFISALVIVIWLPIGSIDYYFNEVAQAPWTQSELFSAIKTTILLTIFAVYFVGSISKIGQTLGMRAWRYKLSSQAEPNKLPAFSKFHALVHCMVSVLLLPLFFTVLLDPKGLSIANRVLSTKHTLLPKPIKRQKNS